MLKTEIESCCYSLDSIKLADRLGFDRIELCGGFEVGGSTPSHGLIDLALSSTRVPVFVMVRPRGGDFVYSDVEFEQMKAEVLQIKTLLPAGFVFGMLTNDGKVDYERLKILVELAAPFVSHFHRAFDFVKEPRKAMAQLIDLGVKQVLSSGRYETAFMGIEELSQWNQEFGHQIRITAGSGVRSDNVGEFIKRGIRSLHIGAAQAIESSQVRNPHISGLDTSRSQILSKEAEWVAISELLKSKD